MTPPMTLLLSRQAIADWGDMLRAVPDIDLRFAPSTPDEPLPPTLLQEVDVALMTQDVIGASTKTRLSADMETFSAQLRAAPRLRWLHIPTAGVDRPIVIDTMRRGVRVTTSSGANAQAVAHSALTGVMMLARGALRWRDAQLRREWLPLRGPQSPRDLAGQTALVVGQGPIGRTIAALLEALEVNVLRVRRTPQAGDAERGVHAYGEVPALAPRCDWVVLACPLSNLTRHLLDARVIAALPRGAHVVNVGRGGVLDDDAFAQAVRSGHLAGGYLDVFETEPLPPESPLWDLPNVLLSAHCSGASQGQNQRAVRLFVDNLPRWLRGEALVNEAALPDT